MVSVPHHFISHSWSNSAHRQLELDRCQLVQTLRGVMAASSLVSTSLLLLHFLAFCSLPSSAQAQELENEWDAPFFCSDASSSRDPTCGTDSEIVDADWSVEMDCSMSDSLLFRYIDSRTESIITNFRNLEAMEVRVECYPDHGAAGGSDQPPQDEAKICRSDTFFGSRIGGPYKFSNLSAAGILPGWTCNVSACFLEDSVDLRQTEIRSCTLPGGPTPSTASADTTTNPMPATSGAAAALTHGEDTMTTTMNSTTRTELDSNLNPENLNIYTIPVIVVSLTATMLLLLAVILLLSSIRIRRQLARKRAWLNYNKQSMVFDPHFDPFVCIDKPAAFGHSPMMSVFSINLLQSLDPTANVYVKEQHSNYLPVNDKQLSLNFETDTDNSEAGSIDLSNPIALNIQKSRSNDDISSTCTEMIVEESEFPQRAYPQSGGACSEQNKISSEQGYVQLPHYQQESVLSPTTIITRLDYPSDDNDSTVTEILSKDDKFKECRQQDTKDLIMASGYVQSSAFNIASTVEQELHSSSGCMQSSELSMPAKELEVHICSDGGYIHAQSIDVYTDSVPVDTKDEPTNVLDSLLNDETYDSDETCDTDGHDCSDQLHHDQSLGRATTVTTDCQEASVYFHPDKFQSAISRSDHDRGYIKDIVNQTIASTTETDRQAYRVEMVDCSSHSDIDTTDCPVAFHPPATITSDEAESDSHTTCTSIESLPGEGSIIAQCLPQLEPTSSSSGTVTDSSPKPSTNAELQESSIDFDLAKYGYVPSELFTRKILVPANHHSSPAGAGFVVHLDFENGHKPLSVTDH